MRNREGCAGGGKGPLLSEEVSLTLATNNDQVLFTTYAIPHNIIGRSDTAGGNGKQYMEEVSYTLDNRGTAPAVTEAQEYIVRRLTPTECERLQGFPDGWTKVPFRKKPAEDCPDGPRYKALGNSMCVNVMRWIGMRIQLAEERDGG